MKAKQFVALLLIFVLLLSACTPKEPATTEATSENIETTETMQTETKAAGMGEAIGAAGGGLIGALAGLGLDEDEARIYKDEVDRGGVLVTVEDDGMHHDAISEIYQRHNSTHYKNW